MNKFYGGVPPRGAPGPWARRLAHQAEEAAVRRTVSGAQQAVCDLPASTFHGPSREGFSGERAAPDSGTARPYTREELALVESRIRARCDAELRGRQPLSERFHSYYVPVTESGCWLWTRGQFSFGYGAIGVAKKNLKAHRVSWELHYGEIPPGMHVCHKCDTPSCVNPAHLFLGTDQENSDDKVRKLRHGRGITNARSKLTEGQVIAIYNDHRPYPVIGKEHGCSVTTVWQIKHGLRWKHVTYAVEQMQDGLTPEAG